MILMIDNYDSFAHNLARYIRQIGPTVKIVRNDQITIDEVMQLAPQAIVISPGPCTPDESGICLGLIREFAEKIPILGVCLGHQAICQSFGSEIRRVAPRHGRTSDVSHQGHALFRNIETPFVAGRYHSLMAEPDSIPNDLEVIATTAGDDESTEIVMAVAHRKWPTIGVQFHPESILTRCGYQLLANFLNIAGIETDNDRVNELTQQLISETADPASKSTDNVVQRRKQTLTPHPW